eukprot:7379583-Prymnesium_polylepis.1
MARGPCTGRDGHAQREFGTRAWLRGAVPRGGERRPIVGYNMGGPEVLRGLKQNHSNNAVLDYLFAPL